MQAMNLFLKPPKFILNRQDIRRCMDKSSLVLKKTPSSFLWMWITRMFDPHLQMWCLQWKSLGRIWMNSSEIQFGVSPTFKWNAHILNCICSFFFSFLQMSYSSILTHFYSTFSVTTLLCLVCSSTCPTSVLSPSQSLQGIMCCYEWFIALCGGGAVVYVLRLESEWVR